MQSTQKYQDIIADLDRLKTNRSNFDNQYAEIARVCDPSSRGLFSGSKTIGDTRMQDVYDSTPVIALQRFGAILDSLLTPRNKIWHKIMPSNALLMKDRSVRLWFEAANEVLFKNRYAPVANFQSQNQKDYNGLGAYGTSNMFTDELRGGVKGFRYKSIHLSEFWFNENHQGIPDKVYRDFSFTKRQLLQRWPDKIPDRVKNEKDENKEYSVIHLVAPNTELDPVRLDYRGMPFASVYILREEAVCLEEGGFTSFPYSVSRYDQTGSELYGRSPAMMAFPSIRTLNEMKKTMLKQGHRTVDPVLMFADDGVMDGFSIKAGAMNSGGVSSEGKALVHTLPIGRLDIGRDLMNDEKDPIKDAFLVSIFQILQENPQMTAYEVMERTKEKGILLAPTIGRQHTEKLGPTIEREMDLAMKLGLLEPMPGLLREAKGEYRIEYDSPISRSARAEESAGIMRTVQATLEVVNVTQNPEPLDHFNWDLIVPEIADINGAPLKWMRSMEEVKAIRDGRAKAQQEQQAIEAAPAAVGLAKLQQQ